jgi:hypothetical protein
MRFLNLIIGILIIISGSASAQEKVIASRIKSAGLFKNGLAVIKRTVVIPEPGMYAVKDVPEPVHGTFWVESNADISTRVTAEMVEVPGGSYGDLNFQEDLVGKEVAVYLSDVSIPAVQGNVVELGDTDKDMTWSRIYEQPAHYPYGYRNHDLPNSGQPNRGKYLILENEKGRSYVDASRILYLRAKDAEKVVKRPQSFLVFSVKKIRKSPAIIDISYLSKGIAWAPSYKVDISDPKKLILKQKAVIKNELEDLEGVDISLISGFPSIQFAHVTSPISLRTNWTNFFTQLNQRFNPHHASIHNAAAQQAVVFQNDIEPAGLNLTAIPSGEGVDLHYQEIGKYNFKEGDSIALEVAAAKAGYEQIVEWVVPDTRTVDGRYIQDYERRQNPEKYRDSAWDAVRFRNPFNFPMTTGPAMVVSQGRFNGQRMSYWSNPGEEATLHINKALSIRTRHFEQEEAGERMIVNVGGGNFRKVNVKGELHISNNRKEKINMVIRRRFSGELLEADYSPESVLLEEGVYSVNRRNELTWKISLKSGQTVKLAYRYEVLVRH